MRAFLVIFAEDANLDNVLYFNQNIEKGILGKRQRSCRNYRSYHSYRSYRSYCSYRSYRNYIGEQKSRSKVKHLQQEEQEQLGKRPAGLC